MVFRTVEALRASGEEILLLIGSDHGQGDIGDSLDLDAWLGAHGSAMRWRAAMLPSRGRAPPPLLYATERGRAPLLEVLPALASESWADGIVVGEALARLGKRPRGGIVAALNMARRAEANPYGVPGQRWVVEEDDKPTPIGCGQHGGWGPDETAPFLLVNGARHRAGALRRATSLVDLAPTMLAYLGLPTDGCDGKPVI